MSTSSDPLGQQAKQVAEDLEAMGGAVGDVVQAKLAQAVDKAAACRQRGRDKVHGAACACEQFVTQRPLRSVLMAVGVGWLLGRFWKRR